MTEEMGPQDRRVDRRAFVERMTWVIAAAGAARGPDAGRRPPLRCTAFSSAFPRAAWTGHAPGLRQVSDLTELTVAESAALIREGELSPPDLLDAYASRIRRHEPVLHAFNLVRVDEARAELVRLSRAPWRGPLHGIPLAIKDNFYTEGIPTTANSLIFDGFVPEMDATTVARLRAAGAVVIGKTQMGPLATTRATTPAGERTTVNAWASSDPDTSPGGSSSGSATAVAARLAASSTGTQTGGSITGPSLAQGLTGLKPTMGRASLYGVIPLTYSRDHPGPLARDAMDAALMLQAMAGSDPRDPRTLGLPPVPDLVRAATPVRDAAGRVRVRWPTTVGVWPGYTDPEPDDAFAPPPPQDESQDERLRREERARDRARRAEAEAGLRAAFLDRLTTLGMRVIEITPPDGWEELTSSAFNNVRLPERTEPFLEHLQRDVRLFGVSLSPWINGLLLPAAEYVRGQRAKLLLLERILDQVFTRCDVVVQTRPFPFDMVGLPLIALPIGFESTSGRELPAGAMLGGAPFGEERLLAVAAAYQASTGWHRRRPADPGEATSPRPGEGRGRIDALDVMELSE